MDKQFDKLKSVCPVLNNSGWVARVRTQSGREVFLGIGAGYTMHQAQMYCDSIRSDIEHLGIDSVLS